MNCGGGGGGRSGKPYTNFSSHFDSRLLDIATSHMTTTPNYQVIAWNVVYNLQYLFWDYSSLNLANDCHIKHVTNVLSIATDF